MHLVSILGSTLRDIIVVLRRSNFGLLQLSVMPTGRRHLGSNNGQE